ncbi:putative 1-phosphatidylinositol-3-phosphate 5-kinase FAB1D, partial [Vitis riparia]
MSNMCHVCDAKLTNSREDKDKHKNENSLKLNGDPISSCKLCGQKHHQEALKWDDLSSYPSRISSPPISLTSSDSTVSSCSEFSVDINSYGRVNQDESTAESRTEDASSSLNGHLQNSNMATQADGIDRSNTLIENSLKNNGHMGRDVEISGTNDGQEGRDTGVFKTNGFSKVGTDISYDNEKDAIIWEPPEPEDDMECSMANSDDDDEFGDGTKWGEPSSLCSFGEEGSGSYKFRDEKQKAME